MNRTTAAVIATAIALAVLAGTSHALSPSTGLRTGVAEVWAGFTAAPNLQQFEALDIEVWLSRAESTEPVRRLDPGTSNAQIVVQSNLRDTDPKNFRVELFDANGIRVFKSDVLEPPNALPTGPYTAPPIEITGKVVFQAYTTHIESAKTVLANEVGQAVSEAERDTPSARPVRDRIQDALAAEDNLRNGVERLRAFDLSSDGDADAAFSATQTALGTVNDRLNEALDLLNADTINWDGVRAKLQAAKTAVDDAVAQINTGLGAVNREAERSFPPTGVSERCNQNTVQLRVAGSGAPSDDFWWTVGTPGAPARVANPEEPTSSGSLRAQPAQIYSTLVDVAGARHNTNIQALVLDALCLPVPGVVVNFSTPADSIVTVQSPQVTTDANGLAEVTLNATDELGDGTATVNAEADSATASIGVTVIGPPDRINLLLGGSEFHRVPNYGVLSTVQVSATLEDANGNNVADGTPVRFTINPPDHTFFDSGQVTTARGQASAPLVFGSATGFYTIGAESGDASNSQVIQVVGNPDQIEIEVEPDVITVNTPSVDERSSKVTVTVRDSEGRPAPDSTLVAFEFVDDEDADWAYFTLRPDNSGRYTTPITDGKASTNLVGNLTSPSHPNETLLYREVTVRVTATYTVGGEVRGSVSAETTVILRGGETIFLPIVRRSRR
ncbi:MAG: hypothetical protein ACE5LU_20115 [Anaerolineae bacterium]